MTFHERVEAAVRAAAPGGHVRVETRAGDHVILWGSVESADRIDRIERAVWAVPGVCNVDTNLAVRSSLEPVE